ncbi:ricin-type beta-trefoil lectin domain protein [Streptomyces sp. NPDC057543]|uniref:ricin-type beta-trefoil lectin domain protein n=1 Tax=Streptomyces sp. NPDC057543 TaxID=3346163 RepID=UPI00367916C7
MSPTSWARRRTAVVASLATALLAGTAATAHADSPEGLIINHGTGRCLATDSRDAFAATCEENNLYQQWTVVNNDDGTVWIRMARYPYQCLTSYIQGGVSVGGCEHETTAPNWVMRDGGKFSNLGGDQQCLTVQGGDLITAACASGYNKYQDWILPVG